MRRAACRFSSRAAWSATAPSSAVGSSRSWTSTSSGVSRIGRHPPSATSASGIARDARRLGAALAGFGAFALAGVGASLADARASSHVQSSGASSVPPAPQPAFGEGSRPDAASLAALAADVSSGPDVKRRRALRLLTQVTLFIDHHDAVLAVPEVLRALLDVLAGSEHLVSEAKEGDDKKKSASSPESTSLATRCLADLAKSPRARAALVADARGTMRALADGLRRDGVVARGLRCNREHDERESLSRTGTELQKRFGCVAAARHASESARLAAELAGDAKCHAPMIAHGVIDALARADAEFSSTRSSGFTSWSWSNIRGLASRREVGELRKSAEGAGGVQKDEEAFLITERARHAAAVWFGLAGTSEGARSMPFGTINRMRHLVRSETDRVAFRYAVGCLARLVAKKADDADATTISGDVRESQKRKRATLRALAPALRSGDGQAACFAAAAARACLAEGSPRTNAALLKEGFVEGALFLLTSPEKGWCALEKSRDSDSRRGVGSASDASNETPRKRNASKRDDGARLCALRLLLAFASSGDDAIRRAVAVKGATVLGEFAAGAKRGARADAGVREKASAVLTELGL
jgi:hypothetical protein